MYTSMYSKEANEKGELRECGRIYHKHIKENGDVNIFCWVKAGRLWYTSDEKEYKAAIKHNQAQNQN